MLDEMVRDRAAAAERILSSKNRLRVVVAGPGTGKTYVFEHALDRSGGKGLALTFIKKLANELADQLREKAETYTFHKFAKMLVYRLAVPGLTPDFSMYPPLAHITDVDIGIIAPPEPAERQVERLMQDLEESRLPDQVLRLGSYYDAASFVDVVYRVFRFLQDNPERTPDYPLIVVDEYQDFTRLETAFIAQLGFASPLLVAGDDDQALYNFRYASADHIRALAQSAEAERHELPFCSRCTMPVVEAVNTAIRRAMATGLLAGRLEKPYRCYLPDKLAASERYPNLTDARCTVPSIMARYVEEEVGKIRAEDIEAAWRGGHPTVLVVGPGYFVKPIYERLKAGRYPQAELRRSDELAVEPIHGYRRLWRDPRSNLGWRILVHLQPFPEWRDAVARALATDTPLVEHIPADYQQPRLATADLLGRALSGDPLTDDERADLAAALGVEPEALPDILQIDPHEDDDEDDDAEADEEPDADVAADEAEEPTPELTILCTTLQGAKGLSAQHVFVVGLTGGHFPRDNAAPTDREVCEFLVALSRTRTRCHLVSTRRFGPPPLGRHVPPELPVSVFVQWVAEHCDSIEVTAASLPPIRRSRRKAAGRDI